MKAKLHHCAPLFERWHNGTEFVPNFRRTEVIIIFSKMFSKSLRIPGTASLSKLDKLTKKIYINFLTFPACFEIPIFFFYLNYNCSNLLILETSSILFPKLFWCFTTVQINRFSDLSLEFKKFVCTLFFSQNIITILKTRY